MATPIMAMLGDGWRAQAIVELEAQRPYARVISNFKYKKAFD